MMDILNSYLVLHRSINIPGMGTIYLEDVPARTDFVNRQLLPPFSIYRFDKYFDAPGREFFSYLASHKKIADYEAIRQYNEFAYNLRARLRSHHEAEWEGVGVFKQDASGEIYFEEYRDTESIYAPVIAERVIRSDESHALKVGDQETTTSRMSELLSDDVYREKASWWIYALILATVGICLVAYYFYRYGMQTGSLFK